MGALIAVRLAETLVNEMTAKIEKIILWSDSTTVLYWIRQISSTYKAFVGNRVSEVHTIMSNLETTLGAGTFQCSKKNTTNYARNLFPGYEYTSQFVSCMHQEIAHG